MLTLEGSQVSAIQQFFERKKEEEKPQQTSIHQVVNHKVMR